MCANARGEENSRFFSSSVTRSMDALPRLAGEPLAAERGELVEQRVRLPLAFRVGDGDRLGVPLGELGVAVGVGDLALHPPDDGLPLRYRVRVDAAGEPLVVDDLQQRGERLRVAVVRRRGQEQPVLEVRGEPADQLGLLGVDRVPLPRRGRGDVVRLVEDQQVERTAVVCSSPSVTSCSSRSAFAPRSQDRLTIVSG